MVRENENAGHLDLLSASCVMLAHTVADAGPVACAPLAPTVKQLADSLAAMAADPEDRTTRRAAADSALAVARRLADADPQGDPAPAAAVLAAQMVTVDVMVFAGVEPDEAAAAVRQGTGEFQVPKPPRTPRVPFITERRPRRQT